MNAIAPVSTATLSVQHLTKQFRSLRALDDISFEVPRGSLTVILGAAGAGKTTLLRSIAGLERPDHGKIVLSGQDSAGLEPKDRDLAMIFDNLALYPDKTGFENIANPLKLRKEDPSAIASQVNELAGRLKITHILDRKPKTMSGGEKQRVALGRALVRTPSLFLLDEPLSSLDAMLRIELRAELRRLQRDLGYTFLMATPDFAEAVAIADTVIMLREGKIVQVADTQTLYDHPIDSAVARFVGAPEINLFPGQISAEGNLTFAGQAIGIPAKFSPLVQSSQRWVELGLRPEDVALVDESESAFTGRVVDVEPLGTNAVVTVEIGGVELRVMSAAADTADLRLGQAVGLSIKFDRLHAFNDLTGKNLL